MHRFGGRSLGPWVGQASDSHPRNSLLTSAKDCASYFGLLASCLDSKANLESGAGPDIIPGSSNDPGFYFLIRYLFFMLED